MKRPSKPTRHQREFLHRKKVDTDNILIIEDTHKYIKLLRNGKDVEVIPR